ncbi:MAG: hypothetical protein H0T41_04750 [Rhodobacteraceae bacterium]|nr:hypothetical protein [Paracoccaceae bacterium]
MKAGPLLALVAFAAALPGGAGAHMARSGWSYDSWCCGGQDCQPIASVNVSVTDAGYLVSIPEGGHGAAPGVHQKLFGYDEVQRSGDGEYHACILPNSNEFRCLYVPEFTY